MPRVKEGALIGALHAASAMIDVSDGLAGDLGHICERSGVSARVAAERLPVSVDNRALSLAVRGDEWHFALRGGEDYELLVIAAAARAPEACPADHGGDGDPRDGHRGNPCGRQPGELVLPDGRAVPLGGAGWDHFTVREAGS